VAASMTPLAVGSSTGGSVRQPAGFCGVAGLKPTYGRVSRYGLIAFGSSLDQVCPIARDAGDLALLLGVLAGYDRRDSTAVDAPVPDYAAALDEDAGDMTLGIPKEYFGEGIEPDVAKRIDEAVAVFRKIGFKTVEISLPHTKYAVSAYYVVATAEASSNLARFGGVHYGHRTDKKTELIDLYAQSREEGFGDEAKRRIMLGTYALSAGYYDAYYGKALKVRTLIVRDFDAAYDQVDLLLSPTSPTTAFRFGDKTDDPLAMYLNDVCTIPSNLAGHPAMSVPYGPGADGMPVGVQLLASALGEATMFRAAAVLEAAAPSLVEGAR